MLDVSITTQHEAAVLGSLRQAVGDSHSGRSGTAGV